MSGPTDKILLLSPLAIFVPARVYVLVRQLWNFAAAERPGVFSWCKGPVVLLPGPGHSIG